MTVAATLHCPYRQATLLQQALTPAKRRVGFFLGAGCPIAVRVSDGASTKPLIPDIAGLTMAVDSNFRSAAEPARKNAFLALLKRLNDGGLAAPNVEEMLTHVRSLHEVVGTGAIDGLNKDALTDLDTRICQIVCGIVGVKALEADGTDTVRRVRQADGASLAVGE